MKEIKKLHLVIATAIIMVAALITPLCAQAAEKNVQIYVGGKKLDLDVFPVIENGRTLVPARAVFEAMGSEVNWHEKGQIVSVRRKDTKISLTVGSRVAEINGGAVSMDVPARIINGRVLVPLRFISESLGETVTWNEELYAVGIGTDPSVFAAVPPIQASAATTPPASSSHFIFSVIPYQGGGYEEFSANASKDLGLTYAARPPGFTWSSIETQRGEYKWGYADHVVDLYRRNGMKIIPMLLLEKNGLSWLPRESLEVPERFGEFAYQVVNRYHDNPAWSGMIIISGTSADIIGGSPLNFPGPVVNTMNSAYDGVKRADPNTVVIGPNLSPDIGDEPYRGSEGWTRWFSEAFALGIKFDWFGIDTYGLPTYHEEGSHVGIAGLAEIRKFLDRNGHAGKPIYLNESGFMYGEDLLGEPDERFAVYTAETLVLSRAQEVNLKGWQLFDLFTKLHEPGQEDFGLMSALNQSDPPIKRKAYDAVKTLSATLRFFDYNFSNKPSGNFNDSAPMVLRFTRGAGNNLWVVFSPWVLTGSKAAGHVTHEPVCTTITINIAPASQATLYDLVGNTSIVRADSAGNVTLTSTGSPVYLKTGN